MGVCCPEWCGVGKGAISNSASVQSVARVHPPLPRSLPGKNAQFPQNVQRRRSVDPRAAPLTRREVDW